MITVDKPPATHPAPVGFSGVMVDAVRWSFGLSGDVLGNRSPIRARLVTILRQRLRSTLGFPLICVLVSTLLNPSRDGWRNETWSEVMPDQESVQSHDEDIVGQAKLVQRPSQFEAPLDSFDADHVSEQKLVESLAHQLVLTMGERWHLSGCDRCARSLDLLRKLREARLPGAR
jgi:hypothetical protein